MYPPEFKTKQFTLKQYAPEDEDRFVEMSIDPTSVQFMGGSTGKEAEERKLFRKIFEVYKRTDERWFWIWGIYTNKQLCAHLEMKETEHTNDGELEIVYMVHPEERRKGLMTAVLSLLKQQQKIWRKRIIATISPNNLNSIALLQKWGIDKKEILADPDTGEKYFKFLLAE